MPHPFASTILDVAPTVAADAAPVAATGPSNKQILTAAQAAYSSYQPVVDAIALAVVASVRDASLAAALAALDGAGSSVTPALVAPFFDGNEVATALGVVRRNSAVKTVSVGAFTAGARGGPGVVGYARDVLAVTEPTGLLVELDIFKGIVKVEPGNNLQYGVWLPAPTELHEPVLGMYVNTTIQTVSVNLKVLLTSALEPYGFMASTGAAVPINSGVFAGTTSQQA